MKRLVQPRSLYLGFFQNGNGGLASNETASLRINADARCAGCFAGANPNRGDTNDNERSHAPQFSALDQIAECLRSHNGGVSKARPFGEGD
jgi:hypothetical protein